MLNMAGKERENYLDTIIDQTIVLKLSFISCDDFRQTKSSHYLYICTGVHGKGGEDQFAV